MRKSIKDLDTGEARERRALAAITGMLANPSATVSKTYGQLAIDAYKFADAMSIASRMEPPELMSGAFPEGN